MKRCTRTAVIDAQVRKAVRATHVVFAGMGFSFASWASRIPQVRTQLAVTPAQLGLVLLCISVGALLALPLSGTVITLIGTARSVAASSVCLSIGLLVVAFGGSVVPVTIGLFLFGVGSGSCDVAANVQGTMVERAVGRSILSRFHAGYSIGTVAGAGIGALLIAVNVSVMVHLAVAAVVCLVAMPTAALRGFLAHEPPPQEHRGRASVLAAWREPRTLIIGVFVLAMAFTEGTGNDWLSLAIISGYHQQATVGTVGLAVFLAAMTTGRWFGPRLLDRFGRVPVLQACAGIGLVGLVLVVFGGVLPAALLGAVLWGCGASLGFPTGVSAASDDPHRAAARVSVTSSIGYLAFLGGPPLIGLISGNVGVRLALIAVAVLLVVAIPTARACRRQ